MGCTGGCSASEPVQKEVDLPESDPLVLIVKNNADTTSNNIAGQLARAYEYAKIPYQTVDLNLLAAELDIPESVRLVSLTTSVVESLSDREVEDLVRYVGSGRNLFAAVPVWDQRFAYLLGIKPFSDYERNKQTDGFKFTQTVFPGFEEGSFKLPVPFYHKGLDGSVFHDSVEVIATSKDEHNNPVIVKNEVGEGTVFLFNSLIGYEKDYRGLMFSISARLLEGIAYPVANVSTLFLDDFPAPLYRTKTEPVAWEYDMTHAEFVSRIWWPDMKALADTFDIDYTTMLAFNYNANVVPPFDFREWTGNEINIRNTGTDGSIGLAKVVSKSRHELAFHGYNHFSLWQEDWPNKEFMVAALQATRKRWRIDNLGPLPVTYVPPTNIIDSLGISALKQGMPQLKYLSSLYIGTIPTGGGREFGPDPYNDQLYDYPRITSGFIADDRSMFKQHSLYLISGIWTHFIHPDDVYQIEQSEEDIYPSRNEQKLGWHRSREHDYGLYEVLKGRIEQTVETYPAIRFKSVKDAVPLVKRWRKMQVYRNRSDGYWQIDHTYYKNSNSNDTDHQPLRWFMYVDESRKDLLADMIKDQVTDLNFSPVWDGYLAQFSTTGGFLMTPAIAEVLQQWKYVESEQVASVLNQYERYRDPRTYETPEEWRDRRLEQSLRALRQNPGSRKVQEQVIEMAVEFDQVDLAIDILEQRILTSQSWRSEDVRRLTTYYGWEDAAEEAWRLLDKLWAQYHDQSIIELKNMMVSRFGVPGPGFQVRWLKRELELKPGNDRLLRNLVFATQGEDDWPTNKQHLRKLIARNPASDSLYLYTIRRSFWYDSQDSTLSLLSDIPESKYSQLSPLASEIAYLYAYSAGNYEKALEWSRHANDNDIPTPVRLEWLLQLDRYEQYNELAERYLREHPDDDSTRSFVGRQLIYEGFYDEGYDRLYPLFRQDKADSTSKNLVHTEIGYMGYEEKKSFYRQYPAFFNDTLSTGIRQEYRGKEGVKVGTRARYTSDNFDNTLAAGGIFGEWGNRSKDIHTLYFDQNRVGSSISSNSLSDPLSYVGYRYQRFYHQQTMQSTVGGGLFFHGDRIRPEFMAQLWRAKDSTFTSARIEFTPVLTNVALASTINRLRTTLYREDFWGKERRLMTTLNGVGNWYTDEVFSYEGTLRLFVQLPFSTATFQYRSFVEGGYLDATVGRQNGIPYWTGDDLLVNGIGLDAAYRAPGPNPEFTLNLELALKRDNQEGIYMTSSARLNKRLNRYLELGLNAQYSSSSIYRYNNFGLTLSYILPNRLDYQGR